MENNEALSRLRALLKDPPEFNSLMGSNPSVEEWVAKADALLSVVTKNITDDLFAVTDFRIAVKRLRTELGLVPRESAKKEIFLILRRNMERLNLMVPSAQDGAFIPVGSEFEAYAEISRIAGDAISELLVVDPYMDDKILTEFLSGSTGKKICLLSDISTVRDELKVAVFKWKSQYGAQRPLEFRLTPARTLHDRLIVSDQVNVWSVTQSFKDFAKRSPGSILKVEPETAKLKIDAYLEIWNNATPA